MSREPRHLRGTFFFVLATALFVTTNTGGKPRRPPLPTVELIWARTLGHTLFIFAIFVPGHGWWRLLRTRKPGTQLTRSLLLLASTSFFFTALGWVPLAEGAAGSLPPPLVGAP